MGLDQYIYRISKPKLAECVYTSKEIGSMNFNKVSVVDFETNANLFKSLLPYVVKRDVECEFYDTEKMISDYNLPNNSRIWRYSSNEIELSGTRENGERVSQVISYEEIDAKYIKTKIQPYYIWKEEEEYYWRKHWDIVDWLEKTMKKTIENTGYYKLNKTIIKRLNSKFKCNIPEESATEESALFYWEWY